MLARLPGRTGVGSGEGSSELYPQKAPVLIVDHQRALDVTHIPSLLEACTLADHPQGRHRAVPWDAQWTEAAVCGCSLLRTHAFPDFLPRVLSSKRLLAASRYQDTQGFTAVQASTAGLTSA